MTQQDATATAGALFDANLFDIVGPIRINYSTSSISGTPRLSYKDAGLDLNLEGEQITRIETSLGELVTVTLESPPDAFTRTFSLIVPTIRLAPGADAGFDTLGIETTDRSGALAIPPGTAGPLQTYRVYQLHGSAQHVAFLSNR